MKTRRIWFASLLLLPLGAAYAIAQEPREASDTLGADDPMMEKMAEFGAVGPAHERLGTRVGTWNFEIRMFQPGQAEAETMQGTSEVAWIMGKRFVEETVTSEFMGQPFHGRGTTGYDNMKQKYVSTWVDDMSTAIYYSEGTYDAATRTFTFTGESPDFMAGEYVESRWVETWTDDDHFVARGYKPGPDGEEFLEMEFHYTRAE